MGEYICPQCKNPIYDNEALLCHFCGGSLERPSKGFLGRIKYGNNRVAWFFLIFALLLAFVLLYIR